MPEAIQFSDNSVPEARLRALFWLVTGLVVGGLTGCAAYHARALPDQADLTARLPQIHVKVSSLHLPGLAPHPFDARHGLDMTDVAILAILNDPALKTLRAREQAGVAQAFAAGLLPGPQLAYSADRPTGNSTGLVTGRSLGLAYDLNALVASHYQKSAARANARAADLNVLWAEWQTAQQARVLFIEVNSGERKLALLKQLRDVMDRRYQGLQAVMASGDADADTLALELSAMQDLDARANALTRTTRDARFALNELLGLAPATHLTLIEGTEPLLPTSEQQIDAALKALPQRRPDLIALQYAYRSADEQVRGAVMAQFPAINLGINRASDTSDIHTNGFSIGITFPFIAGGPASVRAAGAGRNAVWQEYQQRLDEAVSSVHAARADLGLVRVQFEKIHRDLPQMQSTTQAAHAAYARGDLTATAYYNLTIALLNRQLQAVDLATQRRELTIALSTLLGLPPADLTHPDISEAAP